MAKLGFKVKELLGGLDWWKRDGYSTEVTYGVSIKSQSCAVEVYLFENNTSNI